MKIELFLECMERIAPLAYAEGWDNCGLLIEPEAKNIQKVLVALDCTVDIARQAIEQGVQLVLCHHPLFLGSVKRITRDDPDTAAAWLLLRHGIGMYGAHTCLDRALGGVNDVLARRLGVQNAVPFPEQKDMPGMGRIGVLTAPCSLSAFAQRVKLVLHAAVRYAGDADRQVRTVALLGGAGGDFFSEALQAGADVLVTGEVKHHHALAALQKGICLVEAGHYETEAPVLEELIGCLQRELEGIKYTDRLDLILGTQRAPLVGV